MGKVAADLEAQLCLVSTDAIENRIATFVKVILYTLHLQQSRELMTKAGIFG